MNLELDFQGQVVSDLKNGHKHDGTVVKQMQWSFYSISYYYFMNLSTH